MLDIRNLTKRTVPGIPYKDITDTILGKSYELSLVFVGEKLSRRLNKLHRKKDKPANILSFPLEKNFGEIFINLACAESESKVEGVTLRKYVAWLFVHGLLHLKGVSHSSTMEKIEKKYLSSFGYKL